MFGGKIASIGDPIFFPTNSFNVKLNGRFISKDIKFPKNYDINSRYEIVEDGIVQNIDMKDDYEFLLTNYQISFGPNSFPYYILYINKEFDIINNIVEYLLAEAYSYQYSSISKLNLPIEPKQIFSQIHIPLQRETIPEEYRFVVNRPNNYFDFVKKFITNNGPYKFDKQTYKYLFLSSTPNILHKYCFANKLKELMDLLYTPIDEQNLENRILEIFGQNLDKARISYENLSDLYNVFSKRVSSDEILKKGNFDDTFIDVLGVTNHQQRFSSYIREDIAEIIAYKEFIKICDLNPIFLSMHGIKLSILFFSVYIQNRLSKSYITRGDLPINLYPINKTNLILNLLGNIEYNAKLQTDFNAEINKRRMHDQNANLRSFLSSQELLIYGQGLKLYDYDSARFKNKFFQNCVENTLVQMLKSFCWNWEKEVFDISILQGAKPEFIKFMTDISNNINNYDTSQAMKNKFAELITVPDADPMHVLFNSSADGYCYNIKSTYNNFLYFLKYILNIETDDKIYQTIKERNLFISEIIITNKQDYNQTYEIIIKYTDNILSKFKILNGHSEVNVQSNFKLSSFTLKVQTIFYGFSSSLFAKDIISQVKSGSLYYSSSSLNYSDIFINLIKKEFLFQSLYHYLTERYLNIYDIFNYFIKVVIIYKTNNVFLKFVNSIIENYFSINSSLNKFNTTINQILVEKKLVQIEDIYILNYESDPNKTSSIMLILYTIIYFLYKLKGLDTSSYLYLDIFYKTIHNTLTIDKLQINNFFNSFVSFYLYLNSSIFESLYKEKYKIIIDNELSILPSSKQLIIKINVNVKNILFDLLSNYAKPNENNFFINPIINFSVLTYFLKLIFFNESNDEYRREKINPINSLYIQSLTKYYLIKVFDCIIKRQFDNAIFLYDLVKNLSLFAFKSFKAF